jgi:hypothetical protein
MAKGKNSERDKEMAAELKRRGVKRTIGRCEICKHYIGVGGLPQHLMVCKG